MTSFAAALMSCALVIASGYFAGRVGVIEVGGAGPAALGAFIGRFALPALLFRELSTLSFSAMNARLLAAVCAGKAATFFCVLAASACLEARGARPRRRTLAVAALRAIFCTQSNDFALGLPVMTALYGSSHPALVSALYLLSPVSLLLLNPIGFLLMGAADVEGGGALAVVARVARTPLVACTVAGALYHAALGPLPDGPVSDALDTLGGAFTPCALFFTGLSLVGKVSDLTPANLLLPATLSFVKCLALPVVLYTFVGLAGGDAHLRSFGFVYGAIPTAPSVLVYANEYLGGDPREADRCAVSLVVCTLASVPVVLLAGLVVKAGHLALVVDSDVRISAMYLCIPSSLLALWVACSFLATWRARTAARRRGAWDAADARTALLVINAAAHALGAANAATCLSMVLPYEGFRAFLASTGRLATCGTAAAIALAAPPRPRKRSGDLGAPLLTTQREGAAPPEGGRLAARAGGFLFGLALPAALAGGLALAKGSDRSGSDACGFPYGRDQYAVTLAYLLLTIVLSIVGLRKERRAADRRRESETDLVAAAAAGGGGAVPPVSLAAAFGHRILLFLLLHVVHAFLTCAACAARLGPKAERRGAANAVRVLTLIELTFASSMGTFVFLIFGLAPDQDLARHVAHLAAKIRGRSPPPPPRDPPPGAARLPPFDAGGELGAD